MHRSFPLGRGVGIGVMAAGLALTMVGAAIASPAPSGSPDEQIGQGWVEFGAGTMLLGFVLLAGNLRDSLKVTTHAGSFAQGASLDSP